MFVKMCFISLSSQTFCFSVFNYFFFFRFLILEATPVCYHSKMECPSRLGCGVQSRHLTSLRMLLPPARMPGSCYTLPLATATLVVSDDSGTIIFFCLVLVKGL